MNIHNPQQFKKFLHDWSGVGPYLNMCLLTPQGNALLWSQFVLGWVQRNSNLDHDQIVDYELSSDFCSLCNFWYKASSFPIVKRCTHHPRASYLFYISASSYGAFYLICRSADDPFMLYAALHSGPHTRIVTRDELRNHAYNMGDLIQIFKRWQRMRQIHPLGFRRMADDRVTFVVKVQ